MAAAGAAAPPLPHTFGGLVDQGPSTATAGAPPDEAAVDVESAAELELWAWLATDSAGALSADGGGRAAAEWAAVEAAVAELPHAPAADDGPVGAVAPPGEKGAAGHRGGDIGGSVLPPRLDDVEEGAYHAAVDAAAAVASAEVAGLHQLSTTLSAHDAVLAAGEATLRDVDARLGALVAEITRVRSGVASAASRVAARSAAEAHISAFVNEIVLSPALVRHIVDGSVGDAAYERALGQLSKKAAFLTLADARDAASYADVRPTVVGLLVKAVAKVRQFLVDKIDLLQRPNTNVTIVKDSVLARHKYLLEFLQDHSSASFNDVRDMYVRTMNELIYTLFRKYLFGLLALEATAGTAGETVVSAGPAVGSVGGGVAGSVSTAAPSRLSFFGLSLGGGSAPEPPPPPSTPPTTVHGGGRMAGSGGGGNRGDSSNGSSGGVGSAVGGGITTALMPASSPTTPAAAAAAAAARRVALPSFTAGDRLSVLSEVDQPAVVLAVAAAASQRLPFEAIQRSVGKMLAETCTSEHLFCVQLFGDDGRMLPLFFRRVLSMLVDAVRRYAASSSDVVGVLLTLVVARAQRVAMRARRIDALDAYYGSVDGALRPALTALLAANTSALAAAARSPRPLFPGDEDTRPTAATRRTAELTATLLAAISPSTGGAPDVTVDGALRRLRAEFVALLNSLAALYSTPKRRFVFLINNLDAVLAVLTARAVEHTDDGAFYATLLNSHVGSYVEHELADHFPDMLALVRDAERSARAAARSGTAGGNGSRQALPPSASGGAAPTRSRDEARTRAVVRDFGRNWRAGLAHMRAAVLRLFPSFTNGARVLAALCDGLLSYHRRCEGHLDTNFPAVKAELVAATAIRYEIRQYDDGLA
ncbi:hypothetical protein MMPV_006478 [Pyropia vietnamensis]